jgi:hypothetical protein
MPRFIGHRPKRKSRARAKKHRKTNRHIKGITEDPMEDLMAAATRLLMKDRPMEVRRMVEDRPTDEHLVEAVHA